MNKLKFNIYRKPTTTDTTIHADSHHPLSHKMAAYNSFIHRLLTIPLDDNDFRDELNVIKYIAVANGYSSLTIDKLLRKHEKRMLKPRINSNTQKIFISTNYTSFMPKVLCSILNNNSFTISFRTNNKLLDILKPKKHTPPEEKTGIYKLTCNDCECFYLSLIHI